MRTKGEDILKEGWRVEYVSIAIRWREGGLEVISVLLFCGAESALLPDHWTRRLTREDLSCNDATASRFAYGVVEKGVPNRIISILGT